MTDTQQARHVPTNVRQVDRNRAILRDHICGASLDSIGECHDLTHQRVAAIVKREGRTYVEELELDLMVAQKMGFGAPQFVVDFDADGWQRSMCEFVWVLSRLREKGLAVHVTTQPTTEGTIYLLEHPKEG